MALRELIVYDTALNRLGVIFSWISLVWTEEYNTVGSCQIELQRADELTDLLQPDRYLYYSGGSGLMIVKSVQLHDNTLLVNGRSLVYILSERASLRRFENQLIEDALHTLVREMQPWPQLKSGILYGLSDRVELCEGGQSILDYCQELCQEADIGFRIRKSGKDLLFECYKPVQNLNARFSPDYGNMGQPSFTLSTLDYKNAALIVGGGQPEERVSVSIGDAAGADRREMFVSAADLVRGTDESQQDYQERLRARGRTLLAAQTKTQALSFAMTTEDIQLGDLVLARVPELGITAQVRVTRITETSQKNSILREAGLGTPVLLPNNRRS